MSNTQNNDEPAFALILVICVIALAGFAIWYFYKGPILEVLRWIRFGELWVLNLFTHQYDSCLQWLTHVRFEDKAPSPQIVVWTNACFGVEFLSRLSAQGQDASTLAGSTSFSGATPQDFYSLTGTSISTIGDEAARYYRWPIVVFLVSVGYYALFISPRGKFRTAFNLESFIKTQRIMWPVIAPIVNFNPIEHSERVPGDEMPDVIPPMAEAFSPEEWISWHRIKVTNGIPEREATRRAFLLQLGPRWNGYEGLPIYIQGLLAAFALKGAQKRDQSDNLLGKLAPCWSLKGGLSVPSELASEIKKTLKDPKIGGKALEVGNRYAYRTTALLGILRWARTQGGVLAPAQFLWLRVVDRPLWYALNNLGRHAFLTEGAGAMAHFMAEDSAKKPLVIPRIDTAIVTLNKYVSETNPTIPPREEPAVR